MTTKHTPGYAAWLASDDGKAMLQAERLRDLALEMAEALRLVAIDYAGEQPGGDDPRSNAIRAVRGVIARLDRE